MHYELSSPLSGEPQPKHKSWLAEVSYLWIFAALVIDNADLGCEQMSYEPNAKHLGLPGKLTNAISSPFFWRCCLLDDALFCTQPAGITKD